MPNSNNDLEEKIIDYLRANKGPHTLGEISNELALSGVPIKIALDSLIKNGRVWKRDKTEIPPSHTLNDENGELNYAPDMLNDPEYFIADTYEILDPDSSKEVINKTLTESDIERFVNGSTRSIRFKYSGHIVPRCFNVGQIAMSFISVLDAMSTSSAKTISMVGIFAKWGRGKSYFSNVVQDLLHDRKKISKKSIKYDVVEFNAWKYQAIPAIWASLFDTLLRSKNWWFRLRFAIKRNCIQFLKGLLICLAIPVIFFLLSSLYDPSDLSKQSAFAKWLQDGHIVRWAGIFSVLYFIISFLAEHFSSIQSIIQHKSKKRFSEYLGVQADIENELSNLLSTWIKKRNTHRRKVLLYIEDVDRCEGDKMLKIIESLRTVLEQPAIRERLIIVVSIDHVFLWNAIEDKFKESFSGDMLKEIIKDSFDKLFISSITLPELNLEEELQYLSNLVTFGGIQNHFMKSNVIYKKDDIQDYIEYLKTRAKLNKDDEKRLSEESFHHVSNAVLLDFESVKDEGFFDFERKAFNYHFLEFVNHVLPNYSDLHLTPRQLGCVYYRCLFSFNLLVALKEDYSFDEHLVEQIIVRSYYKGQYYKESMYEDVLKMIIPYPM